MDWVRTGGRERRAWVSVDRHHAAGIRDVEAALSVEEARLESACIEAKIVRRTAVLRRHDEDGARARVEARRALVDQARQRWGAPIVDDAWWCDGPRRELVAPWIDADWNTVRTELFFAAVRLHRDFLWHARHKMRQTLFGAFDMLQGDAPHDLDPASARAAWQSLFLVVPVVSTTFASCARMFRHLGAESLGWLMIDEAGQATPQQGVGAIWRSQRVVVVGDPLQLPPIVTIPFKAEDAIRRAHVVSPEWLPSRTSVQTRADALNRFGTIVPLAEDRIWVGAPLRAHRRCDDPMFSIVNRIAYDGQMVDGLGPRPDLLFPATGTPIPASRWIDVVSHEADGHYVPAEFDVLGAVLRSLDVGGQDLSQVFVISPFCDVVRRFAGLPPRRRDTIKSGTIHTAQGKEADIVVLVLGSNPRSDGARRWASSKPMGPNLLNVAVSRARRRLYVIGNRGLWMQKPYFRVLAADLDRLPMWLDPPDARSRVMTGSSMLDRGSG